MSCGPSTVFVWLRCRATAKSFPSPSTPRSTNTTFGTNNTRRERSCLLNTKRGQCSTLRTMRPRASRTFGRVPRFATRSYRRCRRDGLCRAMSVEINGYVDWFGQWWEYSDADAFLLNSGHSHSWRDTSGLSPILVTVEHLERSLELNGLLDGFTSLDLGIARWRRSKRATIIEDRLVELRIALESVLLPDDRGVVGEKRHRLATRGVWLLGETPEQRKS